MQILVELDGVMKDSKGSPIIQGVLLVAQLAAYNQITVMTDMSQAEAVQWLDVNKVVDYDGLLDSSATLVGENLSHRQINLARSRGSIGLFITHNPSNWAYAFDQGIPSIMFAVPSYTRPEFRPDAPKRVRAWNEIEEAVKKQNELLTKDMRTSRSEGVRFE